MQSFFRRRKFLKAGFLSCAIFVMNGCKLVDVTNSEKSIEVLHNDLFPKAKELGINSSEYLFKIVLHHSRIREEDKLFIKNGVKWLNETAVEMFKKSYTKLPASKRQDVLDAISKTKWGESWIHDMMTYIFEAMLGDPIYGGNKNEAGWKWLAFEGGKPRPTKAFL